MLQRIDRAADSPLFLALMQQIQRAELSALYGEDDRDGNHRRHTKPFDEGRPFRCHTARQPEIRSRFRVAPRCGGVDCTSRFCRSYSVSYTHLTLPTSDLV